MTATTGGTGSSLKEYRSLFPYLRRYRLKYALGFFFLVAVDAAQVVIPQFIRRAVDALGNFAPGGGFASGENFTPPPVSGMRAVLAPCVMMVLLMGVVSLGRFLWRYFIHGSSRRIEAEMREDMFEHLLSLSQDFYGKYKIGDLMARATNDLNAVRESIGMGLVALVDGTVMAAAILVIIFVQDAAVAAYAVLPLPLVTVLILLFGKAVGKRFRRAHETYSSLSDAVQETFAGIRVVKSFVKEEWFIKKFADTNDDYSAANMDLVKLFGVFFPFISFLSGITILIVLLVGGIRITRGMMSPGDLVALFRYLQMLIWPLMGAGFVVNMIQRGAVSLGRINEIMRTVPSIRSPDEAAPESCAAGPLSEAAGADEAAPDVDAEVPLIEIKNLSFEFSAGKRVLEDVNLAIRRGSVTGILGRTGSGKSTLLKIISRMIDPPRGTVFIKGVESAAWNLESLRKLFGVTPQDSYLFSDSIKNNIGYSGAEDESLTRAAKVAALEKDLASFQSGWDTVIGERGLTLSGGQKQRTAIARSIAAGREILILDDSLSAVDVETERAIFDALFALMRENKARGIPLTMIIISHRISALSRAGQVIVLDQGRIIESGTPSELLNLGGFYARTAALQNLDRGNEHG